MPAKDYLQNDDDFLQDMQVRTLRLLESHGVEGDEAKAVAAQLIAEVRANWGGQQLYIRKLCTEQRDAQIYAEFNGHNHSRLARKYGIAIAHLYSIVKAVGDRERANRQRRLFDEGSAQ